MFYTSEGKKTEYWNYFVALTVFHPRGFTATRLKKVKPLIWNDEDFWDDVIHRHGGSEKSPQELDGQTHEHCFGNMAGMMRQTMQEAGILKP